jgi:hypothetical protein
MTGKGRAFHNIPLRGLPVAVVAVIGIAAAHGGQVPTAEFVGNWAFEYGSNAQAGCGGVQLGTTLDQTVSLTAGTDSDLVFHVACHCDLPLEIQGSKASLKAATPCSFLMDKNQLRALVTDLTFDLSTEKPRLTIHAKDGEAVARPTDQEPTVTCDNIELSGPVRRTPGTVYECGPDETAIGVVSAAKDGTDGCGIGVGREAVDIILSSFPNTGCMVATGEHGEGPWVLPQAERYDMVCDPRRASISQVELHICRVDGRKFKPMTVDAKATDQFYAVLMLGTRCPDGSIEMTEQIDTPEEGDLSSCAGAAPDKPCGPNHAVNIRVGGATTFFMHFCFFTAAASEAEVMSSFPDIGRPYAVFHDFQGGQPPWVMLKRWLYSQHGSGNKFDGPAELKPPFNGIVEQTPLNGIYFDQARVH